jgi:hypothetical protein
VYEFYYLRVRLSAVVLQGQADVLNAHLQIRDYVHALMSVATFLLIVIFINPMSMCFFPSNNFDGTAKFDPAIVRTVPLVVAIIMSMVRPAACVACALCQPDNLASLPHTLLPLPHRS